MIGTADAAIGHFAPDAVLIEQPGGGVEIWPEATVGRGPLPYSAIARVGKPSLPRMYGFRIPMRKSTSAIGPLVLLACS